MSLRGRVIGLIGLVLLIGITVYVMIAWSAARRELAEELGAAMKGGEQTVHSAFEDLPGSDHPHRDLRQLVATFDGDRHVEVAVRDRLQRVLIASRAAMPRVPAPRWFVAALGPEIEPAYFAVPGGDRLTLGIHPLPASDAASMWRAALSAALVFAVAVGLGAVLIYWVIGRALAPLADLSRGLGEIGLSGYRERVRETGPPELLSLQRGFNAMAERLAEADTRNRMLEAQVSTIQDEERADIARDLHDEIGPYLFAVALDTEMIGRNLGEGRPDQVVEQLRSIQGAVGYMQRQVRELIARLRPTPAAELGLEAAIADLVKFWHSRQPEVTFETAMDGADLFVREPLRDVIYRVVHEAVANALRHAETEHLSITIRQTAEGVTASVTNVGPAKTASGGTAGLGLIGMRERVGAANGILRIDREARGWSVIARFGAREHRLDAR